MKALKIATKIFVTSMSFILALIYMLPNLALFLGFAMAAYSEYISGFFILVFTYNIARMVESIHEHKTTSDNNATHQTADEVVGDGYSYIVEDDKVTFTFRDIRCQDGRQIARLKFMREKFFEEKDEH